MTVDIFSQNHKPFTYLSRKQIIKFVDLLQDVCEISWITTDKNSFEWVEVNEDKQAFMNKFSSLEWNRVALGLFNSSKKSTRYITLEVIS